MLVTPNLDDRTYDDLVAGAEERVRQLCPEWTDFGPADPGRTLVETFAFLTEVLIWRANRLPEAAYIEFLARMGVRMGPPAAASTRIAISRDDAAADLLLPAGTVIGADRGGAKGEAVEFRTLAPLRLAAGETSGEVRAAHAELVAGELLGLSDGTAGQAYKVAQTPILAPLGAPLDLAIGIETPRDEVAAGVAAIEVDGAVYVLWSEVAAFDAGTEGKPVFVADRITGIIRFAPEARLMEGAGGAAGPAAQARALAAIPPAARRIRAWYRVGGGEAGNVVPHALTKIERDGVAATNPAAAAGGRAAETLANALVRGPRDIASRGRAVTAQDYEALATSRAPVARARAHAMAETWAHADRGTVEVVLTPHLPQNHRLGPPTRAVLEEACTDLGRSEVQEHLDQHRPLGGKCKARWVRFKPVRIRVRAALRPYENAVEVADRLRKALDEMLSPLGSDERDGWAFGEPLRSWHINDVARREPAIVYLEDPIIETPEAPDDVCAAIAPDRTQEGVWYAGCGDAVYRSVNNGDGWELAHAFEGETVRLVETPADWHGAPEMRGLVAAITESAAGGSFYVSRDCGDSWELMLRFEAGIGVNDLDFLMREDGPTILFAARDGFREFTLGRDKTWRRILVNPDTPDMQVWALTVARNPVGSAQRYTVFLSGDDKGLFYSAEDGLPGTFIPIGPAGMEKGLLRILRTHEFGGQARVWAGVRVSRGVEGQGCFEYRVTGKAGDAPRVRPYPKGWNGESCRGIAFKGDMVLVATHRAGVQTLSLTDPDPQWRPSDVNCGLPQRSLDLLQPINVLASNESRAMAGPGLEDGGIGGGLYRTEDGQTFARTSSRTHVGSVTLPSNWLFCSAGAHEIEEVGDES